MEYTENMKEYKINEIENKRVLGRNISDSCGGNKPLALFWGASGIEINVKSKEVWIQLSASYDNHEPWVSVEVNGSPVSRFMVPAGDARWYCIARNLNPEKEYLITVLKDTQPMPGDIHHSLLVHKVGLSDDGSFSPLKERKLNIEFIGDSITSGEGLAGGVDEGDWITQWFCASKTYAMQLSRKLDANYSVLSQCGWGICWGWDGNLGSNMPAHYNKICSVIGGDYQKELGGEDEYVSDLKNDYVILNLGTNDNGAFFQKPWVDENGKEHVLKVDENNKAVEADGLKVTAGVKNFLVNIRKNNPKAKIIWTWGMIKLAAVPEYILKGINEYKAEAGDNNVFTLELDAMEEVEVLPEDKGSRGHPGPKTHRLAAEKILNLIKSLN